MVQIVMRKFNECKVESWIREDGLWNCFIQSPETNWVWMWDKGETENSAYKKCKLKWEKEYNDKAE